MKKIAGLLLVAASIFIGAVARATNWPSTISSDTNLLIAVNNCGTLLTANTTSGAGTISVADTTCFPTAGYVTIEDEALLCTGKTATTFTGCTRGADGTTAASHTSGTVAFHAVIAAHHNVLKNELIAMSTYFFQGSQVHIDTTSIRLGISTGTPQAPLTVLGTGTAYNLLASTSSLGSPVALGVTNAGVVAVGNSLTSPSITDSGLTSGRVTYATTGGLLTDSSGLTTNGTDLTVSGTLTAGALNAPISGLGSADTNGEALRYEDLFPLVTMRDASLSASAASGILTLSIKTNAGVDPSASSPSYFLTRSATASSSVMTSTAVSAALSVALSSGSTLGTSNSTAFKLWVVLFNDGGTARMGVINCLSGTSIYPLGGYPVASSTAEGGAGAADSAHVFYTGSAVSSKAYTILGYLTYESGLAQAGNWTATPTRIHMFTTHTPLPGTIVQRVYSVSGAVDSTTTVIPFDDTIPQNTEGKEAFSQAITPTSAAHVLSIRAQAYLAGTTDGRVGLAIFQDSTANALSAGNCAAPATTLMMLVAASHQMLAGTTSATTIKMRYGAGSGTVTINGVGGGRIYGGVTNSFLETVEIAD